MLELRIPTLRLEGFSLNKMCRCNDVEDEDTTSEFLITGLVSHSTIPSREWLLLSTEAKVRRISLHGPLLQPTSKTEEKQRRGKLTLQPSRLSGFIVRQPDSSDRMITWSSSFTSKSHQHSNLSSAEAISTQRQIVELLDRLSASRSCQIRIGY